MSNVLVETTCSRCYVTNAELANLERVADRQRKPLSAVVRQILSRSLESHR